MKISDLKYCKQDLLDAIDFFERESIKLNSGEFSPKIYSLRKRIYNH